MKNSEGNITRLTFKQELPISLEQAWSFFSTPDNLSTITPSNMNFRILLGSDRSIFPGQIIEYTITPLLSIPINWVTEITHVVDKQYFVDEQRFGPYKFWHHKHFLRQTDSGVEMEDIIDYKLPLGFIGNWINKIYVHKQLITIFEFRKQKLEELFKQRT